MTGSDYGPYRATALWNEAVIMFRDNMPLEEHRHRLHKHRNSFTGYDAVTFIHNALRTNTLFNSEVTREQACQLLKQFLKADLICPVKNCSVKWDKNVFYDSHKYIYEFTEQLLQFQRLMPASARNFHEKVTSENSTSSESENAVNSKSCVENIWKTAVIKRIIDLLYPFDATELMNLKDINSKWIVTNASPEWNKIKWNTELPHWILSTMQELLRYSTKDHCSRAYPHFHSDAFKVISDYFKTLESPIILQCFYKLYVDIFSYLRYLDNLEKMKNSSAKMSVSQEDLIFSISSPNKKKVKPNISLSSNNLPPNHCYEAAFLSDDPTIRVVPQSSVDSIHLQKGNTLKLKLSDQNKKEHCNNRNNNKLPQKSDSSWGINQRDSFRLKKAPLKAIDNCIYPSYTKESKTGIVNEGFAIFSPKKLKNHEAYFDLTKCKSDDCLNSPHIPPLSDKTLRKKNSSCNLGYINHALSFSMEDMTLLASDRLDYDYALESLEKLMKVSQYNQSLSDDEYSYHTALSYSEAGLSDFECSQDMENKFFEEDYQWNHRILYLGITVFQLLIMLLPPCNRAQLKNLSVLMHELSRNGPIPGLSLQNMCGELRTSILRPLDCQNYDTNIVNEILLFIVDNHNEIFTELPSELLSFIMNEVYEQQLKAFSFCKQISEQEFEAQRNEESRVALHQLLEHIKKNNDISEKERKKHLKMFKELYPSIYRARFPSQCNSSKSKHFFSFKTFRL